eukprot:TRINITY_DN969_c0_g1_i2.p1 TRINITY_DN969_c0_g1~~TRINITY_DN969_c0_g1_i2.p1  ORF type:complete len:184 (+),score=29.96 TRINITY_DN969_c0_g1_i2:758-1309(+)
MKFNKYCGKCGSLTKVINNGSAVKCTACNGVIYPPISPVVITLITHKDEVLLVKHNSTRRRIHYTCIAGFLESGESIEECLQREVAEEVGLEIDIDSFKYVKSQFWPSNSVANLMIGCYVESKSKDVVLDTDELSDSKWIHIDKLKELVKKIPAAVEDDDTITIPPPQTISYQLMSSYIKHMD